MFVDSFSELGLKQFVSVPTHIKGRTLDVVLSNDDSLVSDVMVDSSSNICIM